ncbi:MAG: PhzF family phenazine biosynthesis isomerase [Pseudobdellovibrionaceae bacterium]
MTYQIGIVKAFTKCGLQTLGNPAGILVTGTQLPDQEMSRIAVEAAQPITSFLVPRNSDMTDFDLRYYDLGGRECHICGHATVAATQFLLNIKKYPDNTTFKFHLNPTLFNGEEKTLKTRNRDNKIEIDLFPSLLREETDPALYKKVSEVLGIELHEINSIAFSTNVRDYVVGLKSSTTLISMKPDFDAMKAMAEGADYSHEGLMVAAPAPKESGHDLYVRVFLPITGVNEDIACGSGNCSIVPYWFNKGMNTDSRTYKAIFPFPEGPDGYIGGIQTVTYSPEEARITIISEAEQEPFITVTGAADKKNEPCANYIR